MFGCYKLTGVLGTLWWNWWTFRCCTTHYECRQLEKRKIINLFFWFDGRILRENLNSQRYLYFYRLESSIDLNFLGCARVSAQPSWNHSVVLQINPYQNHMQVIWLSPVQSIKNLLRHGFLVHELIKSCARLMWLLLRSLQDKRMSYESLFKSYASNVKVKWKLYTCKPHHITVILLRSYWDWKVSKSYFHIPK